MESCFQWIKIIVRSNFPRGNFNRMETRRRWNVSKSKTAVWKRRKRCEKAENEMIWRWIYPTGQHWFNALTANTSKWIFGQPWTPRQAKWMSIGWANAQYELPNRFVQVDVCPSVYPSTCFQLEPFDPEKKEHFEIQMMDESNSNINCFLLPYWMLHLQNSVGSSKSHALNIWPIKCNSAMRIQHNSTHRHNRLNRMDCNYIDRYWKSLECH